MSRHFIKLFTAVALIAVFILQAIWLYNMYTLLEKDLEDKFDNAFSQSFQKEVYFRYNNKEEGAIPEGTILEGVRPDIDQDSSAMYFNEFMVTYKIPFILEKLDSILNKELEDKVGHPKYSLELLDNNRQTIEKIYNGIEDNISNPFFTKTMPIRINNTELIQLNIESPYKIIFQKMLLLLIASLVIGLIIIYCISLQIRIITRQNRIAEIRKDFTHAMIHDMKNPMTTILMGVNALKGGKLDDKELLKKQYFDIITKEGEHLLSLTNKILTIAQFEEGKVDLSKTHINVKTMFDTIIERYKLVSGKNIQFQTAYNDVEEIYADKGYIYEAFSNLIDNAVKYSKDSIIISINCSKDTDNTSITIRDNGIGISLKDQKRIFDKFERVIAPKKDNNTSGFGLGLNYVYQAVTAHGGDIKINSVLSEYSEFTIIIPNKKDDKTSID
jgi:two-component system phosphate regulon sensor histidine kinase PhoR